MISREELAAFLAHHGSAASAAGEAREVEASAVGGHGGGGTVRSDYQTGYYDYPDSPYPDDAAFHDIIDPGTGFEQTVDPFNDHSQPAPNQGGYPDTTGQPYVDNYPYYEAPTYTDNQPYYDSTPPDPPSPG